MAKLVWRVKLVAETQPGVTIETEVARIERDEDAGLAELGLRLEGAKLSGAASLAVRRRAAARPAAARLPLPGRPRGKERYHPGPRWECSGP